VVAIITNWADEAHLVGRMQDAPSGQINLRQEMLRAAGNFANIADYGHERPHGHAPSSAARAVHRRR
jgi:DNA segregation ATPase FtsK/SpoIIIE, S-DNA-T family